MTDIWATINGGLTVGSADECVYLFLCRIHSEVKWLHGRLRRRGWEKQKPRVKFLKRNCPVGQMVDFVLIFKLLCSVSHHRVQIAMDLEVQQVPDEVHPCGVKRCGCRPRHHLRSGRVWLPQCPKYPPYVQSAQLGWTDGCHTLCPTGQCLAVYINKKQNSPVTVDAF